MRMYEDLDCFGALEAAKPVLLFMLGNLGTKLAGSRYGRRVFTAPLHRDALGPAQNFLVQYEQLPLLSI